MKVALNTRSQRNKPAVVRSVSSASKRGFEREASIANYNASTNDFDAEKYGKVNIEVMKDLERETEEEKEEEEVDELMEEVTVEEEMRARRSRRTRKKNAQALRTAPSLQVDTKTAQHLADVNEAPVTTAGGKGRKVAAPNPVESDNRSPASPSITLVSSKRSRLGDESGAPVKKAKSTDDNTFFPTLHGWNNIVEAFDTQTKAHHALVDKMEEHADSTRQMTAALKIQTEVLSYYMDFVGRHLEIQTSLLASGALQPIAVMTPDWQRGNLTVASRFTSSIPSPSNVGLGFRTEMNGFAPGSSIPRLLPVSSVVKGAHETNPSVSFAHPPRSMSLRSFPRLGSPPPMPKSRGFNPTSASTSFDNDVNMG